jgi:hypothetical protein
MEIAIIRMDLNIIDKLKAISIISKNADMELVDLEK